MADADGEASRFEQLLTEYEKAPEVTRERLYLEAIESVYARSSKVLLNAEGSGNMIYLPVDKLLEQQRSTGARPPAVSNSGAGSQSSAQAEAARRQAEDLRIRRSR